MKQLVVIAILSLYLTVSACFFADARVTPRSTRHLMADSELIALVRCEGEGKSFAPTKNTYQSSRFTMVELYKGQWRKSMFVLKQGAIGQFRVVDCEVGEAYILFLRAGINEFTVEGTQLGSVHHTIPDVFEVVAGMQGMWKVTQSGIELLDEVKLDSVDLYALLSSIREAG